MSIEFGCDNSDNTIGHIAAVSSKAAIMNIEYRSMDRHGYVGKIICRGRKKHFPNEFKTTMSKR